MSEENVGIVRRQFELWSEGNLDAWVELWDPDVVVQPPEGWPEGGPRGREALRRQGERLRDSWDEARVEIEEIQPVGEDRVVSRFRYVTRGRSVGMPFDTPMSAAFFLRDRKIIRAHYVWEFAEALEAAGPEDLDGSG
jgi:ketosteroid isomerase-like protein